MDKMNVESEAGILCERVNNQKDHIEMLQKLIPPPDCVDCGSEMELDQDIGLYTCSCHDGCRCFQCAPCSYCLCSIDAQEFWAAGGIHAQGTDEWEENEKANAKALIETGPSAAAMAKPVTRMVIGCQGDYWDGVENL